MRYASKVITGALALMVFSTGCAHQKMKERMALLEQTNVNLTEQLNGMRSELDTCLGQRDDLDTRLATAQRDTEAFQAQLATGRSKADTLRDQLPIRPAPMEIAPGWTAVPGGAMISFDGNSLFLVGGAVLRDEVRPALDAVASTLRDLYADKEIQVFGHTDDQPIKKSGWKDNWQLSTERALAVVRYVQARGIDPARLAACGCGEYRPRVPNTSAANRSSNRRVEIYALEPQTR